MVALSTLPQEQQVATILTASDAALTAAWQRRNSKLGNEARQAKLKGPRCLCGANTLHRATLRGFGCCKKAGLK